MTYSWENVSSVADDVSTVFTNFSKTSNGDHKIPICICCNEYLSLQSKAFIEERLLQSSIQRLIPKDALLPIDDEILRYYQLPSEHCKQWMDGALLAPNTTVCNDASETRYSCCRSCKRSLETYSKYDNPPRTAIANGFFVGTCPNVLSSLNDAERLLISVNRNHSHVFSFFAGQHKSIRGFHTYFETTPMMTRHAIEDANQVSPMRVACVLSGPFTSNQKQLVEESMHISPMKMLDAFLWLSDHNDQYSNNDDYEEYVNSTPVIIDDSSTEESLDTQQESIIEKTVFLPDGTRVREKSSFFDSRSEFAAHVVKRQSLPAEHQFRFVPSERYARDFDHNFLEKSFPLQFPYSRGGVYEDRPVSVSKEVCLQHYMKMADPFFLCPDFVLTLHSMYEKDKSLSQASLCCRSLVDGKRLGAQIGSMQNEELETIMRSFESVEENNHGFLRTLTTSCRAMGHTNEAAKESRNKMFALWSVFGEPSIFFTVSPCDETNFRIRLYAKPESFHQLPDYEALSNEEILQEWEVRKRQRMDCPGACSHDFQNQMWIVRKYLIGWDEEKDEPVEGGGAFGYVSAYTQAVEEQGRKTLHSHFLLWIKEIQDIVRKLQVTCDVNVHQQLVAKMTTKMNSIVSTRLHEGVDVSIVACTEENCCGTQEMLLDLQHYRNLRHRQGSRAGEGVVTTCTECGKGTNSEMAATQQLVADFGRDLSCDGPSFVMNAEHALDDVAMRHIYDVKDLPEDEKRQRFFLINALYNLHRCVHSKGCFKKGEECRFLLPGRILSQTILKFAESPTTFFDVLGRTMSVTTFTPELERSALDSFMNHYSPHTSMALGCNSNVAIGSILQLFYSTTYSSKGTQDDDRKAYDRIVKSVSRRMAEVNEDDPFKVRKYLCIIFHIQSQL